MMDWRGVTIVVVLITAFSPGLHAGRGRALMVGIGDSTTAGTPFFLSPLESPPNGQGDEQGQYAYWIMQKRPHWQVLNYGIRGETTAQIRARFKDALAQHPRCVIILAGVNDINQGKSL